MLGCTYMIKDYHEVYKEGLDDQIQEVVNYDETQRCDPSVCTAMVCEKPSDPIIRINPIYHLGKILDYWNDEDQFPITPLTGQKCWFEHNFTKKDFNSEVRDTGNLEVREFMIGQGSTFWEFEEANNYCKNSLDMSIKWLVGNNRTYYQSPSTSSAKCYLDKGVMPVYLLYSNNTNVSAERAGQIANELNGLGPVILTTEMDFDSSKPEIIEAVRKQIDEMRANCPDNTECMIAIAPKMNDMKAVDELFSDPDTLGKTDLVVYGINTHHSKTRCDVKWVLQQEAANFSKEIVLKYQKPSLIAYALYDTGPNGAEDTPENRLNEYYCDWTPVAVDEAYNYFFPAAAGTLSRSGIIGYAPYALYPDYGPLECNDCAMTTYDINTGGPKNDTPRFEQWFAWCQKYKKEADELGGLYAAFPNSTGGGACNFLNAPDIYLKTMYDGLDFSQPPKTPELQPPVKSDWKCGSCVVDNSSDFDNFETLKEGGRAYYPAVNDPQERYCTELNDPITKYAGMRGLDTMLVRAFMWHETAFMDDPLGGNIGEEKGGCAVQKEALDEDVRLPCGLRSTGDERDRLRPWAVDGGILKDPDGNCDQYLPPGYDFCAIGSMQTMEIPYIFWPENEPGLPQEEHWIWRNAVLESNRHGLMPERDIARGCSEEFNPFNSTHSICMGTARLRLYMDKANAVVKSRAEKLNITDNGVINATKERVLTAYIAAWMYYGKWFDYRDLNPSKSTTDGLEWIDAFADSKDINPAFACTGGGNEPECCKLEAKNSGESCCGQPDFIKYVTECHSWINPEDHEIGARDYAAEILWRYKLLLEKCNDYTSCPPVSKFGKELD